VYTGHTPVVQAVELRMLAITSPLSGEVRTEMEKPENLLITYIYLAIGCGFLGTIITFALILACQYFAIDINKHLWILAIPVALALLLNISFIELYRKFRRK
jgi:hypothetical protein